MTVPHSAVTTGRYYNRLEVKHSSYSECLLEPTDTEENKTPDKKVPDRNVGEEAESKLGSLLNRLRGAKENSDKENSAKENSAKKESPRSGISHQLGSSPKAISESSDEESKVVTARGTEDGLVLRIDGKSPWEAIIGELDAFLGSRRRFLEGGEVSIEWLERLPTPEQSFELEQYLREGFGVEVVSRRRRPAFTTIVDRSQTRSKNERLSQIGSPASQINSSSANSPTNNSQDAADILASEFDLGPSGKSVTASGNAGGESLNIDSLNTDLDEDSDFGSEFGAMFGKPAEAGKNSGRSVSANTNSTGANLSGANLKTTSEDRISSSRNAGASDRNARVERVLKDTIEILEDPTGPSYLRRVSKLLGEDLIYEEDANAKIVFGHFRSGQRLETPYSLIVIGDVNPGADLIAGGDIFVLGSLRGTAHAAAYDDEALDRVVMALSMQPVQLRIGSILSRGNGAAGKGPEVARIENRRIVVEVFNSRINLRKKGAS